jgi:hypothetical protein
VLTVRRDIEPTDCALLAEVRELPVLSRMEVEEPEIQ